MREPWLFWGSLAVVPCAIACFVIAMRVTSERLTRALEVAGEIIAGVSLTLMGYEGGFRYLAKDIWDFKAQSSAGGLFIMLGLFCIADVVAKAFNR
jgi:NO-binding membrane sensor protein with MHYT domain